MKTGLWFTRAEAAELCGFSIRQFSDAVQAKLPKEATKGRGAALRIHGPSAVKVAIDYRLEQAKPLPDESDPLMSGGESPALERYRRLKGDEIERNLAERDGLLLKAQ